MGKKLNFVDYSVVCDLRGEWFKEWKEICGEKLDFVGYNDFLKKKEIEAEFEAMNVVSVRNGKMVKRWQIFIKGKKVKMSK